MVSLLLWRPESLNSWSASGARSSMALSSVQGRCRCDRLVPRAWALGYTCKNCEVKVMWLSSTSSWIKEETIHWFPYWLWLLWISLKNLFLFSKLQACQASPQFCGYLIWRTASTWEWSRHRGSIHSIWDVEGALKQWWKCIDFVATNGHHWEHEAGARWWWKGKLLCGSASFCVMLDQSFSRLSVWKSFARSPSVLNYTMKE